MPITFPKVSVTCYVSCLYINIYLKYIYFICETFLSTLWQTSSTKTAAVCVPVSQSVSYQVRESLIHLLSQNGHEKILSSYCFSYG